LTESQRLWLIAAILAFWAVRVGYKFWLLRGVKRYSVHDLRARLNARDTVCLIDVRTPEEYRRGHIPGAINIPLGSLEQGVAHFDRKAELIVTCQSGVRGAMACRKLRQMGFEEVYNLEGGMSRWAWETE
jgi:rhodanese-related sulfurtransferase